MALFLGREWDAGRAALGKRVELDPSDLLTHGLVVGMTGSGKTGLAIVLIEEVLRQGVPVLAIDPKGDLANLLLLFERLDAVSFEPWIDADAARREGRDVATAAAEAATAWKQGLAEWGLGTQDVAALAASRDAVVYTPGSSAGVALNLLQSLEAPALPFEQAEEDLRDEITGIVTGMLGLLKIEADPIRSREAILLAQLVESAWRAGRGLTLEALVTAVAEPPFEKLGALPVETVFPRRERNELMMALNNLLASPSFVAWREGEPLDVERMLRARDGRPRLSIVSTAHLDDAERLFVTALVLDKVKTWMRRQGGTSELRALVYMDEIFGYFPPHPANPPPKRALLTLLKQARAQGVSVVLATQNPVDLDYKGLANIGTWLIGRLQTEQDKARLHDGLLGTGVEAAAIDALLAGTRKRVFLLHDVHRPGPCLLHSRHTLSYLRGPMTRQEIERLMAARATAAPPAGPVSATPAGVPEVAPVLPAALRHHYLARHGGELADAHVFVKYAVRYKGQGETVALTAYPLACGSAAELLEAEPIELSEDQLATEAPAGLRYGDLPGWLAAAGAKGIERVFKERLRDKLAVKVLTDSVTKTVSQPGEDATAFTERLRGAGGGAQAEKLRDKLEKKKRDLSAREEERKSRTAEKWVAGATAVLGNLGLLTGRKRTISGAGSVLSKNRMENAVEAKIEALKAEIADLEQDLLKLTEVDPARFEEKVVVPAKTDVKLLRCDVVWVY